MFGIRPYPLPATSLLQPYVASGAYADCYSIEVTQPVTHARFVEAFYTTWVFKLERFILSTLASRPSTDLQAGQLARGESSAFAAWSVETRAADQVLLCDFTGRTRSWLMVEAGSSPSSTRLLFGSAVVPLRGQRGQPRMGAGFAALLGFHKVYSQVLLATARRRLVAFDRWQ